MAVAARATGHALGDLALTLTAASSDINAVLDTGARAAAEMIGDCAGVRLITEDGRYSPVHVHHADPETARVLAEVFDGPDDRPDGGYSANLRATREPVVLSPLTPEALVQLTGLEQRDAAVRLGLTAAVLCPLIVDNGYLGYLVVGRIGPGTPPGTPAPGTGPEPVPSGYDTADVDLARDLAGELSLAVATARSAERLRTFEERYLQVLKTTLEGVWQLDAEGVTTFANEPMAVMLGLPREQLLGVSMRGFLDDHGQAELERWLARCREGLAGVHEARLVRADGSTRWVQISVAPVPDDYGRPGGSLCMVTDITDQVRVRGLKRQLDHLRRLDSLGQLIGGIAHDFNNLFTVVAGNADMIVGEAEPGSPQHQRAQEIVEATVRGRTLAHQLLAFGRGGGGRGQTLQLLDLLDDVRALLSRTLGEHIRQDLRLAPDLWPIRGDRGPLEQVLVILAANARDAMTRGGVLTVEADNTEVRPGEVDDPALAGRFVKLCFADTGSGMDEQTKQRALEPFFTTKPSAAGLGLATAAGILRGSGGHIRLDSQPRLGTTVTLLLPAAEPRPSEPGGEAAGDAQAGGHILVVEDQPEVAQLIQRLLRPAGFTVTVATDPQAAMTGLPAGVHPDLLLTDVVMPGMTGPALAAALRERHPGLPVLYMSGYTASALGPQAQLDDDSVLVQKPFNRETLLAAVRRALR